jgi:hypothetical protein
MFYILVSRVPFIYNVTDKKSKVFRTFLVGSICYIIVHGLLYSKKFAGNAFIEKYKQYLLYLAGVDLSLTLGIIYFLDNKSKMDENLFIENGEQEDGEDESNDEDTIADNKMTREEILAQYYQAQQKQLEKPKESPFIKKTDDVKPKKQESETSKSKKSSSKKKEITQSSTSTQVNNENQENNKELEKEKLEGSENKELDNLVELISNTEIPVYQSNTA